jgi:ABC-type Fe3+-citrate transport system substrate-binding protein
MRSLECAREEQPIGYADDGVPAYLLKRLQTTDAQAVGTRNEPNLELLSTLHPDLIIADKSRHEAIYPQLSAIAPTLLFDSYRGSLETQITIFETLSRIYRKEALAQQVVAEARASLAEASELVKGHERSLAIGVLAATGLTAHTNESFKGSLLGELGLPTALQPKEGAIQYLIDLEGVVTLKPEAIVITCAPEDQGLLADWEKQPVWQQLDAVKNQHVYIFNRDLWSKSRGLLALQLVLRDARESGLLTGEPSRSTVCPAPVQE